MAIQANSVSDAFTQMKALLSSVVPEAELRIKAELVYEILKKKDERGAIILGHNYMEPALFHTVPDLVGDSLGLSQAAAKTDRNPIVFCGVKFMAETAKILSPEKTVLLPAKEAGCSLAAAITAQDVLDLKEMFPGAPVITYVNTYADVKAVTDICCTSSNASQVMRSIDSRQALFLPDEYLSSNVARELGKSIAIAFRGPNGSLEIEGDPAADIIGWRGRCEVHEQFTVDDIANARKQFPDVAVISHPECTPEVVAASDYAGSTTKLVEYVKKSHSKRFLILTECSMGDNIIAENPDKDILRLCSVRCPHMNQITLEDTLHALQADEQLIELPEDIRKAAYRSVERMIQIGPQKD